MLKGLDYSYIGNFSNGKFHGYGEKNFIDGSKLCGEYINGMEEGVH